MPTETDELLGAETVESYQSPDGTTDSKIGSPDPPSAGQAPQGRDAAMTENRQRLIRRLQELRNSRVITFVSRSAINPFHAIQLYDILRPIGKVERLDLLIDSTGGDPDTAYKLVSLLREHLLPNGRLGVIVPFQSKSAATILSLGADEIIMGPISELGPIDPQIHNPNEGDDLPAQSIRDFMEYAYNFLSNCKDTELGAVLIVPLMEQLDPWLVGSYERYCKTSLQYANVLLKRGMLSTNPEQAEKTANSLTHGYMSHGYVIDRTEARDTLKLNVSFAEGELWDCIWDLFRHTLTTLMQRKATSIMEALDQRQIFDFD